MKFPSVRKVSDDDVKELNRPELDELVVILEAPETKRNSTAPVTIFTKIFKREAEQRKWS